MPAGASDWNNQDASGLGWVEDPEVATKYNRTHKKEKHVVASPTSRDLG